MVKWTSMLHGEILRRAVTAMAITIATWPMANATSAVEAGRGGSAQVFDSEKGLWLSLILLAAGVAMLVALTTALVRVVAERQMSMLPAAAILLAA